MRPSILRLIFTLLGSNEAQPDIPIQELDIKKQKKRGKDINKIKTVIELLLDGKLLPPIYRDHPLIGNWSGHRDCHIESDWLLIYRILEDEIRLERTGTHSDLF